MFKLDAAFPNTPWPPAAKEDAPNALKEGLPAKAGVKGAPPNGMADAGLAKPNAGFVCCVTALK